MKIKSIVRPKKTKLRPSRLPVPAFNHSSMWGTYLTACSILSRTKDEIIIEFFDDYIEEYVSLTIKNHQLIWLK